MAEAVEVTRSGKPTKESCNENKEFPLQENFQNTYKGRFANSAGSDNAEAKDIKNEAPEKIKMKSTPFQKFGNSTMSREKQGFTTPAPSEFFLNEHLKYICQQHHIQVAPPNAKKLRGKFKCSLCSYACHTWENVIKHIQKPSHVCALEEWIETFSLRLIPAPLKEQIVYLSDLLRRTVDLHGLKNVTEREAICSRIEESISNSIKGCSISLYGSSLHRAGLVKSDLNINVSILKSLNISKTALTVFELLKRDESNNRDVKCNFTSCASITFTDAASGVQCCITFNNSHSCEVGELLSAYLSLDERALILATAFRYWAHLCCLDQVENGTLPPHAFPILVIYYLQQLPNPVLPVLHDLHGVVRGGSKIDPSKIRWETKNNSSLGELWLDLFKFYLLDFDIYDQVVSIRTKKRVYQGTKRKWQGRKFGIEDPFLPDKNIAKTIVNLRTVYYFVSCLRTSAMYFTTPQAVGGGIFLRVQNLPPGVERVHEHLIQRERFLSFIFMSHPFFQKEKPEGKKTLLDPSDPSFNFISSFIVTPHQASSMFERFNPSYLHYEFFWQHFTGGKKRPIVCVLCREVGHSKDKCSSDPLPPLEKIPDLSSEYFKDMTEVCEAVYESCALTESELAAREDLVSHLLNFLRSNPKRPFPDVNLTLFGSSCNGYGLKGSDVDICFTSTSFPPDKDIDFTQLIHELSELLRSYPPFFNLLPITTAKVPILKFSHKKTKLDGDISFHNTLALHNTKLISTYSKIDKRAKILGYVVKGFAKISCICDASKGSLSSYAYILMMVHFLQQCDPPVLPVLQEICRPPSVDFSVENCDVYFYDDLKNLSNVWSGYAKNTKSAGELWIEFLHYYTEVFDFKEYVITIRRKQPLLKFEKLWSSRFMSIEDPFDLDHNLGIGLSHKMHQYILKAFINGRNYFTNVKNMPTNKPVSQEFKKYFEGSKVKSPPPDRGCHICKRIGHVLRECPQRRYKKEDTEAKEQQNFRVTQQQNVVKHHNDVARGGSNRQQNSKDNLPETSRAEREKTWQNKNKIPFAKPVKQLVTSHNWNSRPQILKNAHVRPEMRAQVEDLARKLQVGPYKKQTPQKVRNPVHSQPSQKNVGKVIDVCATPESEVRSIPSMEFYNKTTQYPSRFQG